MAEHYAAPPEPDPYQPSDPNVLRDGSLAGWRLARLTVRLAAASERLEALRPRRAWRVRDIDWREWEAAAQAAADLPRAGWAAWRTAVAGEGAAL